MKRGEIILILASLCVLTSAWIGFNIYHNVFTSTIPEATSIQIAPIEPVFDTQTIDKLKQRKKSSPVFDVIPTISPSPQATSSATVSATPEIIISP